MRTFSQAHFYPFLNANGEQPACFLKYFPKSEGLAKDRLIWTTTIMRPASHTGEQTADTRPIIVSRDRAPRTLNGIEIVPIESFLRMLWNGEVYKSISESKI